MSGWHELSWYSLLAGVGLKSMAVLGAAGLAAILLRGSSAAARHLVWTAAAAALVALPFLSASLPPVRVPVGHTLLAPDVTFRTTASASTDAPSLEARQQSSAARKPRAWGVDWRLPLMLAWAAGAALSLIQMLVGWAAVWRMRRTAKPFCDSDITALTGMLGIRHQVEALEAPRGSMPMTVGLFRPAVLMPVDALEWSRDRRRMVLLHELAHVRRSDVVTHVLARLALSFYWWNPLAWIAWREFLKERERATDDLVLTVGGRASDYAEHLLEVARAMQSPPRFGWAAVAMARHSQLEGRLLAILDSHVNRDAPGLVSALIAVLLTVTVVAPLAALQADVDATIRAATGQRNYDMLENAAKAAESLNKYDLAQKLLESALEIRAEVSGPQSVDYALGLLKLGDLQRRRDQSQAEEFYNKAISVLGARPEAAPGLIYLGAGAIGRKDFEQAIQYLESAQRADPSKAGPALMWMAVARENQANFEEADSLYKRALAIEPDSADAATTMEVYAQFLHRQGREDEATSMKDSAATLRKSQSAQPASLRQGANASVHRSGNGVTSPSLLSKVEPEYTPEARIAKYQGTVVVYAEIGPEGAAENMRIMRGLGLGLDEKAIEAINQWRFKPGIKDGQPVTVAATIEVNYRLY